MEKQSLTCSQSLGGGEMASVFYSLMFVADSHFLRIMICFKSTFLQSLVYSHLTGSTTAVKYSDNVKVQHETKLLKVIFIKQMIHLRRFQTAPILKFKIIIPACVLYFWPGSESHCDKFTMIRPGGCSH